MKLNPKKLTPDETKRANKLKALIVKLNAGEHVQNRQLKNWLTEAQYKTMLDNWQGQLALRLEMKDKPDQIVKYEHLLRQAIFTYNKAESFSSKGKHTTAEPMFNKADGEFEDVLQHLQAIISIDPSLSIWFDRPLDFGNDSELSIDPDSIPRVIVSRSHFSKSSRKSPLPTQSIRDIKLESTEAALRDLTLEPLQNTTSSDTKLAKLLKQLNEQDDD